MFGFALALPWSGVVSRIAFSFSAFAVRPCCRMDWIGSYLKVGRPFRGRKSLITVHHHQGRLITSDRKMFTEIQIPFGVRTILCV